jgi:hypothetical protein
MSGDHNQYQKDKSYLDGMDRYKQVRELVKDLSLRVTEIAWKTGYNKGHVSRLRKEALRQALEKEQEPVAWIKKDRSAIEVSIMSAEYMTNEGFEPLYTAPPKREWVGLTLNEAEDFYEKYTDRAELINAIDKFLEEKNT